jgi:hypothetical protein
MAISDVYNTTSHTRAGMMAQSQRGEDPDPTSIQAESPPPDIGGNVDSSGGDTSVGAVGGWYRAEASGHAYVNWSLPGKPQSPPPVQEQPSTAAAPSAAAGTPHSAAAPAGSSKQDGDGGYMSVADVKRPPPDVLKSKQKPTSTQAPPTTAASSASGPDANGSSTAAKRNSVEYISIGDVRKPPTPQSQSRALTDDYVTVADVRDLKKKKSGELESGV